MAGMDKSRNENATAELPGRNVDWSAAHQQMMADAMSLQQRVRQRANTSASGCSIIGGPAPTSEQWSRQPTPLFGSFSRDTFLSEAPAARVEGFGDWQDYAHCLRPPASVVSCMAGPGATGSVLSIDEVYQAMGADPGHRDMGSIQGWLNLDAVGQAALEPEEIQPDGPSSGCVPYNGPVPWLPRATPPAAVRRNPQESLDLSSSGSPPPLMTCPEQTHKHFLPQTQEDAMRPPLEFVFQEPVVCDQSAALPVPRGLAFFNYSRDAYES
jgi:hypothetical protein